MQGNPATTISATVAPSGENDAGIWNGFNGTVKNVVFEAADGVANANDYGALSLNHTDWAVEADATFENCHFINQGIKFYGDVDFTSCVFDGKNQARKGIDYSIATGEIVIDGCTFSGYTDCAINIAESAGASVVIRNCTITGDISIGALDAISFENCTLNGNVNINVSSTRVTIGDDVTFGDGYAVVNKYNN